MLRSQGIKDIVGLFYSLRDRVSFLNPFEYPSKSIKSRIFFYGTAWRILSSRDCNDTRSCRNTMINAVAIKSPNRQRDCPPVLKFRSRKEISSYWYQHRKFGYISLVTFGSRWTSSIRRRCSRRAGGLNRCELLAIGHRARSNNTRKPVRALCFFLHPPRCRMLAVSFRSRQRFTAIPCKSFTNTRGWGMHFEKICRALHEFKLHVFGQRKWFSRIRLCVLGASNSVTDTLQIFARWTSFFLPVF